jgi:hypothetical protein
LRRGIEGIQQRRPRKRLEGGEVSNVEFNGVGQNKRHHVAGRDDFGEAPQNGNIGPADVQLLVNQALGLSEANQDLNGDHTVNNVVDVQIETNAVLGGSCVTK